MAEVCDSADVSMEVKEEGNGEVDGEEKEKVVASELEGDGMVDGDREGEGKEKEPTKFEWGEVEEEEVVMSQPPPLLAASYDEPVITFDDKGHETPAWLTPGVQARLDFLSLLEDLWLHRTPTSGNGGPEYHITTSNNKLVYCGREDIVEKENVPQKYAQVTFYDSIGTASLSVKPAQGRFSSYCCGTQRVPACHVIAEGRGIGILYLRKSGFSPAEFVYEDDCGHESPFTVAARGQGRAADDKFFPINEHNQQMGAIVAEYLPGPPINVDYKIHFPTTADARQKAAVIAAVVMLDIYLYPQSSKGKNRPSNKSSVSPV